MQQEECKMQENTRMRYAVEWTVGDDVTLLRLFASEEKAEAVAFAREAARRLDRGLVTVGQALFEAGTDTRAGSCLRLLEGFRCCPASRP